MMISHMTDTRRQSETKRRLDILEGRWDIHLVEHMRQTLHISRVENMGIPSQSINLFKSLITQLAVLYDRPPVISNVNANPDQISYIESQGIWSKHQRLNRYTIGLRECLITMEWDGSVRTRLVTPDKVIAYAHCHTPTTPYRIEELRIRRDAKGRESEYWDIWDISDSSRPYFMITTSDHKTDVTIDFTEIVSYPYIDPDGMPYLPWVMYHASESDCLWSPYELSELVDGTLDIARDWAFWAHCLLEASWQQRYAIDLSLAGLDSKDGGNKAARQEVAVSPNSLLMFHSNGDGKGMLGSFDTPIDPDIVARAVTQHAIAIYESLGISGADVQVSQPQSGFAIQVKRDAIREHQKRYTQQFMQGDLEYIHKVALINNLYTDMQIPVDGYTLMYPSLPLSMEELTTRLQYGLQLLQVGLITKADLLMTLNPGMSMEEAESKLASMTPLTPGVNNG